MLYHLNRFLRRRRLQGRLQRNQLELLNLDGAQPAPREVQEATQQEVLRLTSLRQELTDRIPVSQRLVPRLIGPGGHICRMLSRDLGVQIYVDNSRDPDGEAVVEVVGVPDVLEHARAALEKHLIDLMMTEPRQSECEQQFASESQEVVHVFVDNSNISIGCQFLPDGTRDFAQRINIKKFAQAVEGARRVARRVVVGSKPPASHAIWRHWEDAGFQLFLEHRDPTTNREQFVDGRLVGEAAIHVMHHEADGNRNVLVVCTGDGNSDGELPGTPGATFISLVEKVARRGWKVEVWCWRCTCHSRYVDLAKDRSLQVKLCFLDGLRKKVTMMSRAGVEEPADLCVQCLVNEPTHAFQPCSHRILCAECAAEVTPHRNLPPLGCCFLCRTPWTAITALP